MKKTLIMAATLMASLPFVQAQVSVKPYGFIRNYFNFDSRHTYTVIGGEYNMIPYDIDTVDGVDLNDVPHAQFQALTSRFGVAITGPQLGGWSTSGKLEGDFGGFGSNNTVLRLRLAYVKLSRDGNELLLGQDWHPLSGNIMPEVLGMAAGAPFRPHSRTPQLRGTLRWGNLGYTAALLYQLQYMNNGPSSPTNPASTASIGFANNALVPEIFLGLSYSNDAWYVQLGIDEQMLRPRTHAVIGGTMKKVDEAVISMTPTLYAQYVQGMWSVKFRTLLAENTSHLNQLCGYAVSGVNEDGSWRYAPIRNSISYLNIACITHPFKQSSNQAITCNLFLGYIKNLGATTDLWNDPATGGYHIYMKGGEEFTHMNSIYRIAPSVSYNIAAFNFGLEYEMTAVTYGDQAANGSIMLNDNLHQVVNHRLCALVKYNF